MKNPHVEMLLREGIAAAKAGERERARQLLARVVEMDEGNAQGWLWLSGALDSLAEKRACLEHVLKLKPDSQPAHAGLAWLEKQPAARAPESVLQPKADGGATEKPAEAEAPPVHPKPIHKAMAPAFCPFCLRPVFHTAADCPHCGLPVTMGCPACGATVDVQSESCIPCGYRMGGYHQRAGYFAHLAADYEGRRQYQKALRAWQAVEALNPDQPDLDLHLGKVQAALDQVNPAMASYRRALEREPGQLSACLALGETLSRLHRWEEAQAVYDQALKAAPKSAEAHLALGRMLIEQEKLKDAFIHIRQTTELDPQNGLAWLRLGELYELAQDMASASRSLQRAVALLPADSGEARQARQKLEAFHPALSEALATGWLELIRQMLGPIVICLLAALLDAGLRPRWIPWMGWAALGLAGLGAFFWVSATDLPRNPVMRWVDEQGLRSTTLRVVLAALGALLWLAAMGIILMPLDPSMRGVQP